MVDSVSVHNKSMMMICTNMIIQAQHVLLGSSMNSADRWSFCHLESSYSLTELLRLEEKKLFVLGVSYFVHNIPIFILKNSIRYVRKEKEANVQNINTSYHWILSISCNLSWTRRGRFDRPKRRVVSEIYHGVRTQATVPLIVTAIRTGNPRWFYVSRYKKQNF
jgi:hypothetical protein